MYHYFIKRAIAASWELSDLGGPQPHMAGTGLHLPAEIVKKIPAISGDKQHCVGLVHRERLALIGKLSHAAEV